MEQNATVEPESRGMVWISGSYPVVTLGLRRALEGQMQVHTGDAPPTGALTSIVYCTSGAEDLPEGIKHLKELDSGAPILVFAMYIDLPLIQAALKLGARGFIHAGMTPEQIVRAVEVAAKGEIVAPRQLLEHMLSQEDPVHFNILTSRQREILEFVVEGMSNAQIARKLFLSESTIKQHLRAAYKALGVNNRTEAAKLFREGT